MWIYTRHGFCSVRAVDDGRLMVRFRTMRHAEYVAQKCGEIQVSTSHDTDYRYRIVVGRREFGEFVLGEIGQIDYDNFKASVPRDDADYVAALGRTWGIHHSMQQAEGESSDSENNGWNW